MMVAVTVPVLAVMLIEIALQGTVKAPPVEALTPENPLAMYHVADAAE
jgi:hypothetical protein